MGFGRFVILSCMLWTASNLATGNYIEMEFLETTIHALYNGLQYMEDHVYEINLDGAFGCKLVYDILHSFLESRPKIFDKLGFYFRNELDVLSEKAGKIADESKRYLKINDPQYYAKIGGLLEKSTVLMWFPRRSIKHSLQEKPLPCSNSTFNETLSDHCLQEILPARNKKNNCIISKACVDLMTRPRQRGYMLTHQVLYFQILQMYNCMKRSRAEGVLRELQDVLCSNVMRDAEEISRYGYPLHHQDLFMEQIGLCGLWGYKDFYKPEWLKIILRWQKISGCYSDRTKTWHCTDNLSEQTIRRKREEKILEDGCLSHKTTVALLAIAAELRFMIEKMYDMKKYTELNEYQKIQHLMM